MKKQKCIILIDGSNFYFKLKDLGLHNLLTFDFTNFIKHIARSHTAVSTRYYVGRIKQDGSTHTQKLFDGQQKLLGRLKRHKVTYSFGYLLKSNNVFHEKGVDVQIAVEYVGFSHKPSVAMVSFCSESQLLTKEDILPLVKQK